MITSELTRSTPARAQASYPVLLNCIFTMVSATPRLEGWKFREDGSLDGFVFGKAGYRDGEPMTTSEVPESGRFPDHVVTASGSTYVLGAPRGEYVPPREAAPKRKRAKIDRFVAAPAVNAAARLRAARASAAGATFHLVPAKPDWNCFVQRMGGHARNRLEWEGEADAPLPLAADEDFELSLIHI